MILDVIASLVETTTLVIMKKKCEQFEVLTVHSRHITCFSDLIAIFNSILAHFCESTPSLVNMSMKSIISNRTKVQLLF